MSNESLGSNLIFVVSQPRAGSTLLQRILGSHLSIHTVSEPWLMLHPFYALRARGYDAEYNARLATDAVRNFLQTFPGGEIAYIEGIRQMYTHLYRCAMTDSGNRFFLDKTPRYYFIIPELYRTFPEAHYIILLRNPLAVLCSILNTWIRGHWFSLYRSKHDLLRAPQLLLEGIETLGNQAIVIHYEQFVSDAQGQTRAICEELGIDFTSEMVEYGHSRLPRWHLGDQAKVYDNAQPASHNANAWVQSLVNPQVWRLASDYLHMLGRDVVDQMGYPYDELQQILESHRPHRLRQWFTFSLTRLTERPINQRNRLEQGMIRLIHPYQRLIHSYQRRGIGGTAHHVIRRVIRRVNHAQSSLN